MIILYPLNSMKHEILLQRLAFFGTAFLAILALSIFSWFFTGKMIAPLEENRQAQTEFIAAASHELRSPLAVILSGISAMKKAEPLMQEHHMNFSVELPEEELPLCCCDPERISQVLGILLDNAISYVPEHGKIRITLTQNAKSFCLSVIDNGPGIPDSAKTSVFRRFYRADSARNNRQHFGLGLCIAYEIITLHQGTITVQDTPGGGSTFLMSLYIPAS